LKEFAFGVYAKAGVLSVPCFQPLLHIFQSSATRSAGRSFRVPRVLDDNRQSSVLAFRGEAGEGQQQAKN